MLFAEISSEIGILRTFQRETAGYAQLNLDLDQDQSILYIHFNLGYIKYREQLII